MKRFGQIEIITAFIIIVTSLVSPVRAEILWSGDVDPSDPSTWDSSTWGYIGKIGNGTMHITGGSDVLDYHGYIAYSSGSTGEVTVDGAGSTWTNSLGLYVGDTGSGTLNITGGGAVSNNNGWISASSEVTVDGEGSTWTNSGTLTGRGTLNITGGGAVSNIWSRIGPYFSSMGEVTVDGIGSTWTNSSHLYVGEFGNGTVNIIGGGFVSNASALIGVYSSSTSEVTVDGAGSIWTNSINLTVGEGGNGTLNITDGGVVSNDGNGWIGDNSGSTGAVTVDGEGSTWTNNNYLYVGYKGSGMLNITGGGLVSVAEILTIDYYDGDDGFINMATGGMLALFGDADDSLVDFLGLIDGTDAIRFLDESVLDWADIAAATYGIDYTLEYLTEGDLTGYTMLTVPEPGMMVLFGLGSLVLRRRRKA